LLGAADYSYAPLSRTLGTLLVDTFALSAANAPESPLDLVPVVSRDLKERTRNPHERVLAIVTELLTAPLTDTATEAACRELHSRHQELQEWYGEDGEKNPFYANRPEFIWGAVVDRSNLPTWLALVEKHFPRSPALAEATREKLLLEGNSWLG